MISIPHRLPGLASRKQSNVLVIGGAGYIGSHMARLLEESGYRPIVFDDLSTGHRDLAPSGAPFIEGDLKKQNDIESVFEDYPIHAVMHFSASSLVGESVVNPIKYYENNVTACVQLLKAMQIYGVNRMIFSSSAAVYGEPTRIPISEEEPTVPVNPYGRSKRMIENILEDQAKAGGFSYIALRYFNACGADAHLRTGERHEPESHLIPNVLKVAAALKKEITVFGNDYPTSDGTCVRDYIHVEDITQAHLLALRAFDQNIQNEIFNLGSGSGYSVLRIVREAERVTGRKIRVRISARRPGDPAILIASAKKAGAILKWKPTRDLTQILESAWKWEMLEAEKKIVRV
jgi:UDP-glucose 4-epimerase